MIAADGLIAVAPGLVTGYGYAGRHAARYGEAPRPRESRLRLRVGAYCLRPLVVFPPAPAWAGIAALNGPQDCVTAMVAEFDRRRAIVVEGLNKLPNVSCITPKGAFYAFPNIQKTGWKAKALASSLLEDAGVATIGGPDFGVHGEGYIRLSYANSAENILRALSCMGEFLGTRQAA